MFRPRSLILGAIASAVCVIATGAGEAAASQHFRGTISFPDTLCGFSGITTFTSEDNFGSLSNGGTYDNGRMIQTFTADNGRAVRARLRRGTCGLLTAAPIRTGRSHRC